MTLSELYGLCRAKEDNDCELGLMCKKAVVAYFKVFTKHLFGWSEVNHEKPQTTYLSAAT
jgi:hypothetical protein